VVPWMNPRLMIQKTFRKAAPKVINWNRLWNIWFETVLSKKKVSLVRTLRSKLCSLIINPKNGNCPLNIKGNYHTRFIWILDLEQSFRSDGFDWPKNLFLFGSTVSNHWFDHSKTIQLITFGAAFSKVFWIIKRWSFLW